MALHDPAAPASASTPRLLSRRQLLQAGAGLGALVVLGALPGEAEGATLPSLTASQLTGAMGALPRSGTVRLPGGGTAKAADLWAAVAAFAVADSATPNPASNPVAALGVLCALAAWSGRHGTLDLSVVLPGAPVKPLRLAISALPGGVSTDTLPSAVPTGLVVRPSSTVVLIGTLSGQRVLAALEDPVRRVAGHPRLELVLLRAADVTSLLAVLHARLDSTGTVVLLASGSKVPLRPLASSLASRLVHAAGVRFVDAAPIQPPGATTSLVTDEPIVPAPPTSVVPAYARITPAPDGRMLALDAGGNAVGRARYRSWRPDWAWTSTAYQVEGYTIRELADALGLTFASFAPGSEATDGDPSWELVANTLIATDGLDLSDQYWLFGQWSHDDWARVVSQWSDVSAALDAHVIPPGFAPDWSKAELELGFAKSHGARYIQGGCLLFGSPGTPSAIYNGGFSADDLRKILEFAVRVRVIKYTGRIQEWSASAKRRGTCSTAHLSSGSGTTSSAPRSSTRSSPGRTRRIPLPAWRFARITSSTRLRRRCSKPSATSSWVSSSTSGQPVCRWTR